MLLVGIFPLLFASFLLVCSTLSFSFNASFCRFKSLGFDQLSISYFFVVLLLTLHDCKLGLFEDFHASLF